MRPARLSPAATPPTANSTRSAFSKASTVMILSGVRPSFAIATARAPLASAWRRRSAMAYIAIGFMPMPMWLACTSMFSVWAWRAGLMLHCQATTPSVLL